MWRDRYLLEATSPSLLLSLSDTVIVFTVFMHNLNWFEWFMHKLSLLDCVLWNIAKNPMASDSIAPTFKKDNEFYCVQGFFTILSFLRKQTRATHSNATEECIFGMNKKNKTSSCRSLSLCGTLSSIMLVKTYINNLIQMETTTILIEKSKKLYSWI